MAASAAPPPAVAAGGQVAQDRAHVEEDQRGEGEALGDRDRGQAGVAEGEDLALLGGDVDLLDRLAAGPVGDREQRRGVLAPSAPASPLAARTSPSASRIAAPRRSGDISVRKASAPAGRLAETARSVCAVGHLVPKYRPVSLARASWITVVAVCAIAAVLFALSGYTGYAITVGAVGLAAAVNLLPAP